MSRSEGLLTQIEAGVLDGAPLSSLLQKCIVLGGQAGSVRMRDWARQELNGYAGAESLPDYRRIPAVLMARITNNAGYNPLTQELHPQDIPEPIRNTVDWGTAELYQGIGEWEALANSTDEIITLSPGWSAGLIEILNKLNVSPNSRVATIYWALPTSSVRGLLVRVRTALAELVSELLTLTPEDQSVPDKRAADQVIQFIQTGDRSVINYTFQKAEDGAINSVVVETSTGDAVTASGTNSTATGSRSAVGDNSTVVGDQTVDGEHNTVAGRDLEAVSSEPQPKDGWWKRLRNRGMFVALFTVIAGIIAVLAWLGVTPHSPSAPPGPSSAATTSSRPSPGR